MATTTMANPQVDFTFKDVSEGTEVTVTHERFVTELSRSKHEMGWTSSTAKLKDFAESAS
jgi:Activator of Hsp90 ATPase homolog 1-like protein